MPIVPPVWSTNTFSLASPAPLPESVTTLGGLYEPIIDEPAQVHRHPRRFAERHDPGSDGTTGTGEASATGKGCRRSRARDVAAAEAGDVSPLAQLRGARCTLGLPSERTGRNTSNTSTTSVTMDSPYGEARPTPSGGSTHVMVRHFTTGPHHTGGDESSAVVDL